jgi:hypothetical protein
MQQELCKKRGRPRKNMNLNKDEITKMLINKQDEIVLFLPIPFDDNNVQSNISKIFDQTVIDNNIKKINIIKEEEQEQEKEKLEEKICIKEAKFIDMKTNNPIIKGKKVIACWWCSYDIEDQYYHIPDRCDDSVYYVFGYFCSPNCAVAFNFDMDDYKSTSRNALIEKTYGRVNSAPHWKYLEKFAGHLPIEQFKKDNVKINTYPQIVQLVYNV